MFLFKKADKNELCQISRLADTIWTEHYTPIIGADQVEYMLKNIQNEPSMLKQLQNGMCYFTVLFQDEPVGYMGYVKEENNVVFLSKLYILDEFRGKGALNAALEHIQNLGAKSVYLTVNKNNFDSIKAYEKKGFISIREQVSDIGGGYVMDDYVMELKF